MTVIKDLHDLIKQGIDSAKDREAISQFQQILSMFLTVQGEQSAMEKERDHALADYTEVEKLNASLQAQCDAAEQRNIALELEITSLKEHIADLKKKLPDPSGRLEEEAERILMLLTGHTGRFAADGIASLANLSGTKARYWLDQLSQRDLVLNGLVE